MRDRSSAIEASVVQPTLRVPDAIDLTSPPAQNALLPAPRTTTQPISGSLAASVSEVSSPSMMVLDRAFMASGRFMVSNKTPSVTVLMNSDMRSPPVGSPDGSGGWERWLFPRSGRILG
jgi:hypothetical protein